MIVRSLERKTNDKTNNKNWRIHIIWKQQFFLIENVSVVFDSVVDRVCLCVYVWEREDWPRNIPFLCFSKKIVFIYESQASTFNVWLTNCILRWFECNVKPAITDACWWLFFTCRKKWLNYNQLTKGYHCVRINMK